MLIDYKQAANQLQMTIPLLKWFESYAPKKDRLKLRFNPDGTIDENVLFDFDKNLKSKWQERNIPNGIEDELKREAKGCCALCGASLALVTESVHIERKGQEIEFYCQHPHNLIRICVSCHTRYDKGDPEITNDVLKHAKQQQLSKLMEDINRDILIAEKVDAILVPVVTNFEDTYKNIAVNFESPPPIIGCINSVKSLSGALLELSKLESTQFPAASGVLASHANHLTNPDSTQSEWDYMPEYIPEEWECGRGCGEQAMIDEAICAECGVSDYDILDNQAEKQEDNTWKFTITDEMGTTHEHHCKECGSIFFEISFKAFCGYCDHMLHKDN